MKQRFSQHMRYYERSLILVLMLFSASVMQAQNRTVKGTVSDAQGEPIIGANVVIVGGTKGVTPTFCHSSSKSGASGK